MRTVAPDRRAVAAAAAEASKNADDIGVYYTGDV
jgi:hypothetical protein